MAENTMQTKRAVGLVLAVTGVAILIFGLYGLTTLQTVRYACRLIEPSLAECWQESYLLLGIQGSVQYFEVARAQSDSVTVMTRSGEELPAETRSELIRRFSQILRDPLLEPVEVESAGRLAVFGSLIVAGICLWAGLRLSKSIPTQTGSGLTRVGFGLGWDASAETTPHNLDAALFRLASDGKVPADEQFIFYNNLKSPDGAVEHLGDHFTGAAAGEDEIIYLDLDKVAAGIQKIVLVVSVRQAGPAGQTFGHFHHAFVRLVNWDTDEELGYFDLDTEFKTETAAIMAELVRQDDEWRFVRVGQGYPGGLSALAERYGVKTNLKTNVD